MNLKKVFFNNSFKNTSYILKSDLSNESIIIDVPEDPYPIIDNISDLDIKLILLTHHHLDHAGGIDILRQHTNAPVAIGAEDVGSKPDDRVAYINPDIKIKNGDTFDLGNEKISAISVPGHTNGSNCFLINKSLFTGDVIFPGRAGRTDSVEQFDLSIKNLKNTLYLLDDDQLADDYFFAQSSSYYKPLWAHEVERRGKSTSLYSYSINMGDTYGYKNMLWNHIIVWDRQQEDFLKQKLNLFQFVSKTNFN